MNIYLFNIYQLINIDGIDFTLLICGSWLNSLCNIYI